MQAGFPRRACADVVIPSLRCPTPHSRRIHVKRLFFSALSAIVLVGCRGRTGAALPLLHSSQSSDAVRVEPPRQPLPGRAARRPRRPRARHVGRGPPRFHRRGRRGGERRQGPATQTVWTAANPFFNDPFFRYFFGEEPETFGGGLSPRRARRVWRRRLERRLRADHTTCAGERAPTSPLDSPTVAAVVMYRWTDIALLKVNATGLPVIPWCSRRGLLPQVGARHLETLRKPEPDGDAGHRLGDLVGTMRGRRRLRGLHSDRRGHQPRQLGGVLINGNAPGGINTAIYSQSGGYQGVGFAVYNLACLVMSYLIKHGEGAPGGMPGYLQAREINEGLADAPRDPGDQGGRPG